MGVSREKKKRSSIIVLKLDILNTYFDIILYVLAGYYRKTDMVLIRKKLFRPFDHIISKTKKHRTTRFYIYEKSSAQTDTEMLMICFKY